MPGWLTDHFCFFDFLALWRSGLSAKVPEAESQKLEMVGYSAWH